MRLRCRVSSVTIIIIIVIIIISMSFAGSVCLNFLTVQRSSQSSTLQTIIGCRCHTTFQVFLNLRRRGRPTSIVFLLSLAGNLLVLVVILGDRARRTTTNYFLVNLSIADLLGILFMITVVQQKRLSKTLETIGIATRENRAEIYRKEMRILFVRR